MSELLIMIEGNLIGRLRADKAGRLSLDYEAGWRESPQGHSLSVTMPLAQLTYLQKPVLSYLWNLLPENPNVLQRWGQQYHVSAANPFKLLANVGADVPGAAQFIPPERLEEIQSARQPTIVWMSIDELGERLQQLRADIAAVRRPGDIGKMSLPGAQAKTAYYWDKQRNRWGVPGGRTPTTHIIKPCVPGFDGLVENEHMCQALGLMPGRKYEEDGGPAIAQIVTLIRRVSSDPDVDVDRFLQANMFNWLIGGTDGHSKNDSILVSAGDEIRLAPLYA